MTNDDVLKELKKISKIITLSNGEVLEKELAKYATTPERKKIWIFIDGKQKSEDIAKTVGTTKRSVDRFLDILEDAELIDERKYGIPPTRRLDYVPSEWISLIPKQHDHLKSSNNKPLEEEQNG